MKIKIDRDIKNKGRLEHINHIIKANYIFSNQQHRLEIIEILKHILKTSNKIIKPLQITVCHYYATIIVDKYHPSTLKRQTPQTKTTTHSALVFENYPRITYQTHAKYVFEAQIDLNDPTSIQQLEKELAKQ